MALSVALRRSAVSSNLFARLMNPVRSAAVAPSVSVTRSFNTNAVRSYDDDDSAADVDRRGSDRSVSFRRQPSLFGDVFDTFSTPTSLSQMLNLMDNIVENPFVSASRGLGAGSRRGWDVKEDKDSLHLRMDMPGVDKDGVKVSVEQNTLIIKGECEKESDEEESGRRYSSRIDLPPELYNVGEIKAEMKNGVLKVVVPKVKEEERKNVFHINVN